MKNKKLLREMSQIDEKYVAEAALDAKPLRSKNVIRAWSAVAACFCCAVIAASLWLFLPLKAEYPDVSQYSDSEYYGIIVKLNEFTYRGPQYKNNFEKYFGGIFKGARAEDNVAGMELLYSATGSDGAPGSAVNEPTASVPDLGDGLSYEEVTDNQVEGVIEGDLIKRSNTHIYYLSGNQLRIYTIDKEDSALVGTGDIGAHIDNGNYYFSAKEMYLSQDCKTVTVIAQYYMKDDKRMSVAVMSFDVSDPANIAFEKKVTLTGEYLSSRVIDGEMLVMTRFFVGYKPDFSHESSFVPQIDLGDGHRSIAVGSILSPDKLSSAQYTCVVKLDAEALDLLGESAFLSYSESVYVSTDTLYVTRTHTRTEDMDEYVLGTVMTDISAMRYKGEGFEFLNTVTVEGSVKDQYSMDEYEGILRVVTTTSTQKMTRSRSNREIFADDSISSFSINSDSANLYCIDLNTFEVVASLLSFAPKGESVRSVRFDGEVAYVCTSIELKDPVFFIDLSDLGNITYKDTGTIPGFSTSLVDFGEGVLLGIGVGDSWGSLKVELYVENGAAVTPLCSYEGGGMYYSESYKSYYIDRENQLIGIGVTPQGAGKDGRYLLLHFDGSGLTQLLYEPLFGNDVEKRGVYIDGYMYMLGEREMLVRAVELN